MKSEAGQPGKERWQLTRREFLRLSAGTVVTILLPGCRRTPSSPPALAPYFGPMETARYKKPGPWKLGRSGRGDLTAWMVMYSAHVEYGAREKFQQCFAGYLCCSANWDPNKQIEDIKLLLAQGIDLLLIDPLDTAVVRAGVEQAMRAGVPVIMAPTSVQTDQYVSWVSTGEEARGATSTEWLCSEVSRGSITVLHSIPAANDSPAWLRGVRRVLDSHPGVHQVSVLQCPWSSSEAKRVMGSHLAQSGRVDGVIVNNGVVGLGVVEAFLELGQAIPPIAGADDWNGWLRTAKEHSLQFLALSGGANLGLYCVGLATQVLAGQPVPRYVEFPYQTFDRSNLDAYYRPDLSDHYWAIHDLPDTWISRMFRP